MKMSNGMKINLLILVSFIGIWSCKQLHPKEKTNEVVIDNIHIPLKPCVSAVSGLFGEGVDTTKACECLIPNFYNLIKHDTLLVEKFKEYHSLFKLDGFLNDSFAVILSKCVKANIIDPDYKFILTSENKELFKEKLKIGLINIKEVEGLNKDRLTDCITNKISASITISEYFSDDYCEVPKIKKFILECIQQAEK